MSDVAITGAVARVNTRGFGFVRADQTGKEYFFHARECRGKDFAEVQEGDRVSFEVEVTPKGLAARSVEFV